MMQVRNSRVSMFGIPLALCFLGLLSVGCTPQMGPQPDLGAGDGAASTTPQSWLDLHEIPVPVAQWREHRLARCAPDVVAPNTVEQYLGTCAELFRDGSGSDGILELEMALAAGVRHPLILLTLGQLYLLAGQGDPDLLPEEGPAADVGDWSRNKQRLLGRAAKLLREALKGRPDDAAVDYLLGDVDRARGDFDVASQWVNKGMEKCTGGRSFRILQLYQDLNHYPARYLGGASAIYPPAALAARLSGDVVLDLLLDPQAGIRQIVVVSSPGKGLTESAEAAMGGGTFSAARVGKYPVWSWLRVTVPYNLDS